MPNWQSLERFKKEIIIFLIGGCLLGFGILSTKIFSQKDSIEIIETESNDENNLIVEISGSVEKPGVYSFLEGARVEDALIASGGLSKDADRQWVAITLNRAEKIKDGQKIYIPSINQSDVLSAKSSSGGSGTFQNPITTEQTRININTANQNDLESLWGIGPVTAQNIIEQRPYSGVEELLTKKILKENVYERNKDLLSVY